MKSYYSEYAAHCIRFYFRYPRPRFHTDVDKNNWTACDNAIKCTPIENKDILTAVYEKMGNSVADAIPRIARLKNRETGEIWDIVKDFERTVAILRGLI